MNKRRRKQGKKPFEPLYTKADARETLSRFRCVGYDSAFTPLPEVEVVFRDAGHILGSAIAVLDLNDQGRRARLVFSGDIGRKGLPILRDPRAAEGADYVIMESTYGDRLHEGGSNARAVLRQAVTEVQEGGGMLLIPAFAVGRTQEIVYHLNALCGAGELSPIDAFVDSPLAVNATDVFRLHPECWDADYVETMTGDADDDPLSFPRLRYLRSAQESMQLNGRREPAIIIAASGMCEGGRIIHHLRHHGVDANSTILFVAFQAEHTLGRKILEGKNPVSLYGERTEIRARVREAEGYSAHADRNGLLGWADRVQAAGDVRRIFLVHGEDAGLAALARGLEERGAADVRIPERGQRFEL